MRINKSLLRRDVTQRNFVDSIDYPRRPKATPAFCFMLISEISVVMNDEYSLMTCYNKIPEKHRLTF